MMSEARNYKELEESDDEGSRACAKSVTSDSEANFLSHVIQGIKHNWRLFVVKPVLIFYGIQFAVTGSITTQLWLDRTCRVVFNYNDTVCSDLSNDRWKDLENKVQEQVTKYQVVDSYLMNAAPILISLYLGPVSDQGRKLLMYIPFSGHLLSGIVPLVFLYFSNWPPQVLWMTNVYTLTGGYRVLQIAMYGYIGDITNQKNRTTLMALLSGIGILVFPAAEALGGQIYKYLGYYAVYGTSLAFSLLGIIYIYFVPESVTKRSNYNDKSSKQPGDHKLPALNQLIKIFKDGNRMMLSSIKCVVKNRGPGNRRKIIIGLLLISMISHMEMSAMRTGLLFTEKMFDWSVVDYTNFTAYSFTIYGLRTFITTPILCYFMGIHDCMLAITGGLASISGEVTTGLATQGWMMYYASALTVIGGIESTPLRSLLSKCVDLDEFGKVFTMSSVASSLAGLLGSTVMPILYGDTLDTYPGAIYFFMAGAHGITVAAMAVLYWLSLQHEKVHGPLGREQDDIKEAAEANRQSENFNSSSQQ